MYHIRKAIPKDSSVIVNYRIVMFQTVIKESYDREAVREFEVKQGKKYSYGQ
jgi:hypothetical protein